MKAFRSGIFPIKEKKGKGLKILTPKRNVSKIGNSRAQIKTVSPFENLLNKIRQFIYFLYRGKEGIKKLCNNIIHSIK